MAPTLGAHPRSRGEHQFLEGGARFSRGSSPLTRGARTLPVMRWLRRGLIPAHAGSTIGAPSQGSPPAAHPRSRGEHLLTASLARKVFGSSPLTRGARGCYSPSMPPVRLIPAHAGSTNFPLNIPQVGRAHPRSRGEHIVADAAKAAAGGSSPLTRGALSADGCLACGCGAHPRSRGEHSKVCQRAPTCLGSSPLTRGALRTSFCGWWGKGLIPAHAGSTRFRLVGGFL